jgi:hypothetical protein
MSQNSRNQGFSYSFCFMIEGSGSGSRAGSGSIPLTNGSGSGSGRPKNTWIRIRNTVQRSHVSDCLLVWPPWWPWRAGTGDSLMLTTFTCQCRCLTEPRTKAKMVSDLHADHLVQDPQGQRGPIGSYLCLSSSK